MSNKYLEKIAGPYLDNRNKKSTLAKDVTTGTVLGAGTVGGAAASGGYIGGHVGMRLGLKSRNYELNHQFAKRFGKTVGKIGLGVGAASGAAAGVMNYYDRKQHDKKHVKKANAYLEKIAVTYSVKSPGYIHGKSVNLNQEEMDRYSAAIKNHNTPLNELRGVAMPMIGLGALGTGVGALINRGNKSRGAKIGGAIGTYAGTILGPSSHKSNLKEHGLEEAIGKKKFKKMVTHYKVK